MHRVARNLSPPHTPPALKQKLKTIVTDPEPVKQEITRYCEACREHGTTVEFVLKDISTIANNPDNLTQWAATVKAVIDNYYPA